MPVNWFGRNGLFPVRWSWIRPRPAPALFTKVPGAVCWAGIRRLPVFPNVSRPSPPPASRALSLASCEFGSRGGGVNDEGLW